MAPATDGLASSQRPLMRYLGRVRVTKGLEETALREQLLATGTGRGGANRRRPSARSPDDTAHRVLRGALAEARGPRVRRIAARQARHWGQASSARRAGRTVEQAVPEKTFTLGKPVRDGGGSHRRSRSGNTVALTDVATKTPVTRAPLRARRHEGKEQLPHALGTPCSGTRRHQQLMGSGVVCSLSAADSAVTTRGTHAAAQETPTEGQRLLKTLPAEETHVRTFTIGHVRHNASRHPKAPRSACHQAARGFNP